MIRVLRSDLLESLKYLVRLTSSARTLPVLSNVYIFPSEGNLHLLASNYEMWLEVAIPYEGEITDFMVKGRTMEEIVSLLSGEEVEMEVKGEELYIASGKTNYHLQIWKEEFPQPPTETYTKEFTSDPLQLKEGYAKVSFAVAKDDIRPEFTGILISAKGEELHFVASDASRLALKKFPYEGEEFEFLIPDKAFSELVRLLKEGDEIMINHNELIEFVGRRGGEFKYRLISRSITRKFPPYEKVIPTTFKTRMLVNRDDFFDALMRVRIVARENIDRVKLVARKDEIEISASAPAVGSCLEIVPAMIDGEEGEWAFNVNFLLDGLKVIDEDDVIFELGERMQAGKMRAGEREDWLYIVMPMQLG